MDLKVKIDAIRQAFAEKRDKSADLDIIIAEVLQLPYGQLKKVMTDEVMAVLEKYGYTE